MKSGKVIEGKVTEVGVDEVKYRIDPAPDGAVFSVRKIDVVKIIFESGHVERYLEEIDDPESYAGHNNKVLKLDFFPPLLGYTGLWYEQSIRPGMSWEAGIGIIGLGKDAFGEKPRGANFRLGVRFLKTPEFKSGNTRYWHLLKGTYIKPEVILGNFVRDHKYTWYDHANNRYQDEAVRQIVSYGAVNMVLGNQMVFDNVFALDLYAGIGYGFVRITAPEGHHHAEGFYNNKVYYYGTSILGEELPVSYTMGVKLGFLFK